MAIELSPRIQARIAELVEQEHFPDAEALIDAALDGYEDETLASLRALIAEGTADIGAGRVVEYTPALREELKREALQRFADGERAGPDVRP